VLVTPTRHQGPNGGDTAKASNTQLAHGSLFCFSARARLCGALFDSTGADIDEAVWSGHGSRVLFDVAAAVCTNDDSDGNAALFVVGAGHSKPSTVAPGPLLFVIGNEGRVEWLALALLACGRRCLRRLSTLCHGAVHGFSALFGLNLRRN
jgi:hypothetical protein